MPFCTKCGSQVNDQVAFCPNCGASMTPDANTYQQPQQPQQTYQQPQQTYQQPQQAYQQPMMYVKPKIPGRGYGISSMVLGIIGLVYSFYCIIAVAGAVSVANSFYYYDYSYASSVISSSLVVTVIIFSILSILATSFGMLARGRGYRNGVSTSGVAMGIVGLCLYVVAILIALTA